MDITRIDGTAPIYRLTGKLSFADNEAMRPVLEDMSEGSGRTIILDLSTLDYVDSFGIGLFLVALDEVNKAGNRLVVRNPQGAVRRIFALANLDTLLEIEGAEASPAAPLPNRKPATVAHNGLRVGAPLVDDQGGITVTLGGRFTFNDHEEFEKLLAAIMASAGRPLTLDLQALEFMDSAGLSMVLIAREEAEKNNTKLTLSSPTGRVMQLLRLAAVDTLVDIREAP